VTWIQQACGSRSTEIREQGHPFAHFAHPSSQPLPQVCWLSGLLFMAHSPEIVEEMIPKLARQNTPFQPPERAKARSTSSKRLVQPSSPASLVTNGPLGVATYPRITSKQTMALWPAHVVDIHILERPWSRHLRACPCSTEIHPLDMRIGMGRAPKLPDGCFANWAWLLELTQVREWGWRSHAS